MGKSSPATGSAGHPPALSADDYEKGVVEDLGDLPDSPSKLEVQAEKDDAWLVEWDLHDVENPMEWGRGRRWFLTMVSSTIAFTATFASSLPSGSYTQIQEHFESSTFMTTLVISIFVLGYAVGPILWAPLSEVYGRRPVFIGTFSMYTLLIIPCALAPNLNTLLAVRFFGGVLAACSLTNSGGVVGDLWPALDRNRPFATFGITPSLGPIVAPVVSGFLSEARGFRVVFWLLFAVSSGVFLLFFLNLPETYHPVLLRRKAERLRRETGEQRYWARHEREDFGMKAMLGKILMRPILMLVTEPIVLCLSTYMAAAFAIIYLNFELYPAVFIDRWHFSQGVSFLPFLLLGLGNVLACCTTPFYDAAYTRAVEANDGKPAPEERMKGLLAGGIVLALGFFMFGAGANHHWAIPALSGLLTGYGIFWVFQSCMTYLGDCYLYYAASAFAAAQMFRSVFGFALPLLAGPLINRLGVMWTAFLVGFFALLLAPIPFVFYKYGKRIRGESKFAPHQ